jgi:hypothetical protein
VKKLRFSIEKRLENRCKNNVKKLGGKYTKSDSRYSSGKLDRLVIMPHAWPWFVEFKDAGKDFSPLQKIEAAELRALGQKVRLINSDDSLNKFLDEIQPL